MSKRSIQTVAVLGAGTMGAGIAAACAQAGCETVLLDVSDELAQRGKDNMLAGRAPMLDDPGSADLITVGSFENSLDLASNADWICEAIVEDLETKRGMFSKLEAVRKPGSIVTTNTSGIPLRSISDGMPEQFRKDVAVTHFFNPVKVMRLLEVVPGEETDPEVITSLATFARDRLGKGVVYAKDTVNFIGNRIGCFWMLAGLHKGGDAQNKGISIERIDALMSAGFKTPSTGLYGLIDLVGLDVMDLVADNLDRNLSSEDAGRSYLMLPAVEQAMLDSGQLGRKTGGGFYRMLKNEDGSRTKQMFQPASGSWVDAIGSSCDQDARTLAFEMSDEGNFVWSLMSKTLCYAADLVTEISDDIVNIDRAMRWGFNWKKGPFELLDELGPKDVADRLRSERRPVPRMLAHLESSGQDRFYSESGASFLGADGAMHDMPAE
ncbi:MAG: 3-hydroxyacyl-CoA dehydrogenase NAD-binding domain-containing protein [Acidiferrobacterales bacterium]|nr:3-hydroxyacyl-CoA dehydrogenase NAD-binding domain-containing protein [Acidiferrobacterales bacterium]